jgi:lipopolysaccharide transport protein LptA
MCASAGQRSWQALWVLLGLVTAAASAAPAPSSPLAQLAPQVDQPIDLDAASSEFDRRNNRLIFQRMRITQGTLKITADAAEATRLDFENGRWIFKGNVVMENQGARVVCDNADLLFLGHQLSRAKLTGAPARFEQQRPGLKPTQGHAGTIDYDVTAATIRLSSDAWLSDGANEVSGERISYDLRREYVTADADGSGQIRMRINPPPRDRKPGGPAP